MRDKERVLLQEKKNYDRAREIFNELLKGKNPQYQQMPDLHCTDLRMYVGGTSYNIETKERSTSIYTYNECPIKVKKLINMRKDTKDGERLLYMALVTDGNYFIWDLDKIDWCNTRLDNMRAKKQQYNIGGTYFIEEPYYFLPLDTAIRFGNKTEK